MMEFVFEPGMRKEKENELCRALTFVKIGMVEMINFVIDQL